MPYQPLAGYQVAWQLTSDESRAFSSGAQPVSGEAAVTVEGPVPAREKAGPFRLVVKLLRPDGSVAMERVLSSQ